MLIVQLPIAKCNSQMEVIEKSSSILMSLILFSLLTENILKANLLLSAESTMQNTHLLTL
jgi:hypothetical protein